MEKNIDFTAHRSALGYVGNININVDFQQNPQNNRVTEDIGTIVILDRSGSMSSSFNLLLNTIIPKVFQKLNYSDRAKIDVITFESKVEHYSLTCKELFGFSLSVGGNTVMAPAIKQAATLIETRSFRNYRILVLSDGDLSDQGETVAAGSLLGVSLKKGNYKINSQAVRFSTNSSSPDTRGMSSLLQLNTNNTPTMVDISAKENVDKIVNQIAALFEQDGMNFGIKLVSGNKVIKEDPWANPSNETSFKIGKNIIWLKSLEDFEIELPNGQKHKVKVKIGDDITAQNYKAILGQQLDSYMQKAKILKVVDDESSNQQMDQMITFFNQFEAGLELSAKENEIELRNPRLSSRVVLIKRIVEKRCNSFTNQMNYIRNDEKVKALNSQQQAEYLRNLAWDQNIGKQVVMSIASFDECIRKEVNEMAKHFKEIADIDDSVHTISFYSTCTTFEGIKTVIELTKDRLFNSFTAMDIIKLINITGVAARAKKDKFCDPTTYHLKALYPGCTISLSDVLVATEASGGKDLKVIGRDDEFNAVVPFFDDERIHQFLLKYAPKLLEYHASVGMRGQIVDVPHSWEQSILCGVLKMVQLILTNKSELYSKSLFLIKRSYETAFGKQFSYIDRLVAPTQTGLSNSMVTPSPSLNNFTPKGKVLDLLQELTENEKKESETRYTELEAKMNAFMKEKNAEQKKLADQFEQFRSDNRKYNKLNEEHMKLTDKYVELSEKMLQLTEENNSLKRQK